MPEYLLSGWFILSVEVVVLEMDSFKFLLHAELSNISHMPIPVAARSKA